MTHNGLPFLPISNVMGRVNAGARCGTFLKIKSRSFKQFLVGFQRFKWALYSMDSFHNAKWGKTLKISLKLPFSASITILNCLTFYSILKRIIVPKPHVIPYYNSSSFLHVSYIIKSTGCYKYMVIVHKNDQILVWLLWGEGAWVGPRGGSTFPNIGLLVYSSNSKVGISDLRWIFPLYRHHSKRIPFVCRVMPFSSTLERR